MLEAHTRHQGRNAGDLDVEPMYRNLRLVHPAKGAMHVIYSAPKCSDRSDVQAASAPMSSP